jgi:hypothetical protein
MANKGRRVATAAGFVSGVISCLDAIRDARETWPPDALWRAISRPHRLELCGGIALIIVTLVLSLKRKD